VGSVGDIQHHSNATHDFYVSNTKIATVSSAGILPPSATSGSLNLGGTNNKWNNVYANNFIGNLTVSSTTSIVLSYVLPETGGSASWINLGTWSAAQNGRTLILRIVAKNGYNAATNQNQYTILYFKTSNGSSNQSGFYGDGSAVRFTSLGSNNNAPSTIRVVQNSQTSFTIYGSFSSFTGSGSHYIVEYDNGTTWTNNSTLVSAPGGTYIDITPTLGSSDNLSTTGNNQLLYQASANSTQVLGSGSGGQLLQSNGSGSIPSWVNLSDLTATNSTNATNLRNGSANSIPYQSAVSTTTFLAAPGSGSTYFLTSSGGAPSWATSIPSTNISAAGSNGQVQFNDNGALAGNSNLTFNKTTNTLTLPKEIINGNLSAWNTTTPGTGVGGLHLGAASGTLNTGPAITFGARDSDAGTTGQAGIYINSDGSYGTRMYFATTDSYATGSKVAMSINESGYVNITRSGLNVSSNITNGGFDFILGTSDQSNRGNSGSSRALVKEATSTLVLNYAGDFTGGVRVGSNLRAPSLTVSTTYAGNFGSIASSWAGDTRYPTLFGDTADRWIMHINPHISYTQNGVNGFTGSMTGATIRMAANPGASTYWDMGIGTNGVGSDKFSIGRAGTDLLNVSNNGTLNVGNRKATSSNVANFGQLEPHGSYTDANSVQQWGGTFIQSSSNCPNFNGNTQHYQMMLSLGSNYDWGSGNTYAAQIAFARNVTTPYIGIRYKEGGGDISNWGGWQKIAAGTADTATQVINTVTGTNSTELVRGNMADNDQFRILIGGTASDSGYVELATADNGNEPIYVRQYTGVFGTIARTLTLLDGSGNSSFPGSIYFNGTSNNAFGSYWAGGGGYPAYQFTGGNSRFGFSSTGGVVDVYADGNFYATDNSYLVLHTGNIATYAPKTDGGTFDSIWYFRSNKGQNSYVGSNNTYGLEAYSSDGGAAGMSFHRGGYYAVNMGLDPDNVFRIGGWSASANRLQLDMSGNLTMAGLVDCVTPNSGTTGGLRIRANASTNNAYLQFTNNAANTQYSFVKVTTDGAFQASGDIVAFASDERLKTNIEPIENAVDKVLKLRGFTYNFNEVGNELGFDRTKRHAGVSAQEVQAVLPEAVCPAPISDEYLTVKYDKLVPLLIEAIKEQNIEIEKLKEKLDNLTINT